MNNKNVKFNFAFGDPLKIAKMITQFSNVSDEELKSVAKKIEISQKESIEMLKYSYGFYGTPPRLH